ncbi:MAG: ParA family protein [bacterium]
MKKYAIVNYKGGTGKTCTVVNLAHGLALNGKKVLIVDVDPQSASAYHLGVKANVGLYELLMGDYSVYDCITPARKNLHIIVASERLFTAEIKLARLKKKEFYLAQRLANLSGYDYVFVDCGPSINILNQNALLFAENVVLPVSMEYFSLIGVRQLLNNIKILNRIFSKNIQVFKVLPTFFDVRTVKSREILKSLNRVFLDRVVTPVRHSVDLSEAPGRHLTIFEYAPESKAAEDYVNLIKEVIND